MALIQILPNAAGNVAFEQSGVAERLFNILSRFPVLNLRRAGATRLLPCEARELPGKIGMAPALAVNGSDGLPVDSETHQSPDIGEHAIRLLFVEGTEIEFLEEIVQRVSGGVRLRPVIDAVAVRVYIGYQQRQNARFLAESAQSAENRVEFLDPLARVRRHRKDTLHFVQTADDRQIESGAFQ